MGMNLRDSSTKSAGRPAGMNVLDQDTLNILLVEDEEGHIQLILRAFESRFGVRLTVARNLGEARARLAEMIPDLAIVDLLLPDGRGIELLEEQKGNGFPFPAVIMTSHGDEEVAVEAMKAGALDYLVKSEETFSHLPHFARRALREWHHITERRVAEERLRETNRELEAFVYTISHDLRSPLAPIIGYAEYLRTEYGAKLDERALDSLDEIEGQANRMLILLEDLLDLAHAGYLDRPQQPVDAGDLLQEVLKEMAGQFPKGAQIIVPFPLPHAHLPETLLTQIFRNLVGNALRYAGGTIEVSGEREDHRVCYFVRDHGPGIPAAERDRIFEVFFRGSTAQGSRGTGVGLATVRKIARSYGGKAWVEETPGGGSTFRVLLEDGPNPGQLERSIEEKRFLLHVFGEYCRLH
jgi:signal transduction histidine kinase